MADDNNKDGSHWIKDTMTMVLVIKSDFIWTPINSGRPHIN